MNNHLLARPALRTLILTAATSVLTLGATNAALAAPHGGFGGGAHAAFGARAGFGAPVRGFAGRGFVGGRYAPYGFRGYWGPGWGWGWGLGWYLPVLPLYYSTYWWDGVPYYYSNDYYYQWNPAVGEYEAVVPPPGLTQQSGVPPGSAGAAADPAGQPPAEASELFAYPKNGQSPEQQAKDKSECRSWARSQIAPGANGAAGANDASGANGAADVAGHTAADAAAPPAGAPAGTAGIPAAQRAAYLRAEAACLEGRNYSVQ